MTQERDLFGTRRAIYNAFGVRRPATRRRPRPTWYLPQDGSPGCAWNVDRNALVTLAE